MVNLDLIGKNISIKFEEYNHNLIQLCRRLPNRSYDGTNKRWLLPFSGYHYDRMLTAFKSYPDCKIVISEKLAKAYKGIKKKEVKQEIVKTQKDATLKSPISRKLYPYQRVGVRFMLGDGNYLLADSMGLGKSLQGIALSEELKAKKILCVVPATLLWNWAKELEKWLKCKDYEVYDGTVLKLHARFSIINYEALRLKRNEFLRKVKWDLLLGDEAHRIKNRKAQQSKAFKKLKAKKVVLMTGTPILNHPDDIWHLLHILYPKVYFNYWDFFEKYVKYKQTFYGKEILGAKNQEKLKVELKPFFIRRLKKEVLPDLPDETFKDIIIELDPKQKKIYKTMEKDFFAYLSNKQKLTATNVLSQMIRLKQIAVSPKLLDPDSDILGSKIKGLLEFIEDHCTLGGNKLVIFSQFRGAVDLVKDVIKVPYVEVTGSVKKGDRIKNVRKFIEDPECKLLTGTIQAAGIGIDGLQEVCDNVVFLDKVFTPALNEQAKDRIYRIGQKNNITVTSFIAKDTIEEKIEKMLLNKTDIIKSIIENREI